jgi:hypothetical protein
VVESSGNLVARRRRLRAEGTSKIVDLDSRFFLSLRRIKNAWIDVWSTLRTLSALKEVAD